MAFLNTIKQGGRWMLQRLLINMGPNDASASVGFGVANVEQWRWEVRADATDGQGYKLCLHDHKNGVDRLTISGYGSVLPYPTDQVLGYLHFRWREMWMERNESRNVYLRRISETDTTILPSGLAPGYAGVGYGTNDDTTAFLNWSFGLRPDGTGGDLVLWHGAPSYGNNLAAMRWRFSDMRPQFYTGIMPAHIPDSAVQNDSLYYSTTNNKLCYKDPAGVVHPMY